MTKRITFITFLILASLALITASGCGITSKGEGGIIDKEIEIDPFANNKTPEITNISPVAGSGGTIVTIIGNNFGPFPVEVFFADKKASTINVSDEVITVIAPGSDKLTAVNVKVVDAGTLEGFMENGFAYNQISDCSTSPIISEIIPNQGYKSSQAIIHGTNFSEDNDDSTVVVIGGLEAEVTGRQDNKQITVSVPNLDDSCHSSPCLFDVQVTNPTDGCGDTLVEGYTYLEESGDAVDTHWLGYVTDREIAAQTDPYKFILHNLNTGQEKVLMSFAERPRKALLRADKSAIILLQSDSQTIVKYDIASAQTSTLVDTATDKSDIVISGDGQRIAWTEYTPGGSCGSPGIYKIYYFDIDSSSAPIASGISEDKWISIQALSNDHLKVLYSQKEDGNYKGYCVWEWGKNYLREQNLTGGNKKELLTGTYKNSSAADEAKDIYFASYQLQGTKIFFNEYEGWLLNRLAYQTIANSLSSKTEIDNAFFAKATEATSKQDGQRIFFLASEGEATVKNIFSNNPSFSEQKQVTFDLDGVTNYSLSTAFTAAD